MPVASEIERGITYFSRFPFVIGDVTLKNLSLKPSALDELNLPVKTVYGHLGTCERYFSSFSACFRF